MAVVAAWLIVIGTLFVFGVPVLIAGRRRSVARASLRGRMAVGQTPALLILVLAWLGRKLLIVWVLFLVWEAARH